MRSIFLLLITTTVPLLNAYNIAATTSKKSATTRRAFYRDLLGTSVIAVAPTLVTASEAEEEAALIRQYPSIQYLVPIYNLQDALGVLESELLSNTNVGIKRASQIVDRFLAGGFLSNKNIFRGMCVIYVQEIKYQDPSNLPPIMVNQNSWLDGCDATLQGIVNLQKPLQTLVKAGADVPTPEVIGFLRDSQTGLQQFLNKVPREDIEKMQSFIKAVGEADVNKNGKLDSSELNSLSKEDQALYKIVGELLG